MTNPTAAATEARAATLQPDTFCPACGKPPALRITADERDIARGQHPQTPKVSFQCQYRPRYGRPCHYQYAITAGAYARAK